MILLDTNAFVAFARGDQKVVSLISNSDGILMSNVVVGELLFGFRNGSRFRENMDNLRSFLAEPDVMAMPVSRTTADLYGLISADLRKKGKPIPTNDIRIAAHAVEADMPLVSFDAHFRQVERVKLLFPETL